METSPRESNIFEVPSSAQTIAGATFFAQHLSDLTWGVGQEMLARQVEELVAMILDGVERSREAEAWKSSSWIEQGALNVDEAIKRSQNYFDSKAAYARQIERSNSRTALETALCRYVDNFLCYLSDLLRLIFKNYPDALASSESSINVKDVFAYSSLDDLLSWLTERTINDLSFKGFGEIEAYYKRRFGFDLVPSASQKAKISLAIAARNLLVHRRGLVDDRFIQMTGIGGYTIGNRIDVSNQAWHELIPAILQGVHDIDKRAARKFGFQAALVVPFGPPAERRGRG